MVVKMGKKERYIPTESFHEATEITFLTEITFFTRDDLDLNSEKPSQT